MQQRILAAKLADPNRRFMLSIAGWGHEFGCPANRQLWLANAVNSLNGLAVSFHLDGIDVNYEVGLTQSPVYRQGYEGRARREELSAHGRVNACCWVVTAPPAAAASPALQGCPLQPNCADWSPTVEACFSDTIGAMLEGLQLRNPALFFTISPYTMTLPAYRQLMQVSPPPRPLLAGMDGAPNRKGWSAAMRLGGSQPLAEAQPRQLKLPPVPSCAPLPVPRCLCAGARPGGVRAALSALCVRLPHRHNLVCAPPPRDGDGSLAGRLPPVHLGRLHDG